MRETKQVKVINKLTEKQISDARVQELEERVTAQDEIILELRNMMIDIRKKLIKINK
jgi:uncharacterized coiled-coil protein SlyX